MATLTVAVAARTGVDVTGAAATSGGDAFANDGQTFLLITNGDSGSHTVTAAVQAGLDGHIPSGSAVTVAAGVTKVLGPFQVGIYNDTNGLVQLTYSAVTSVTVKAVRCPSA